MKDFKDYNWCQRDTQPKEDGMYLVKIPNDTGGFTIVKDEWKDNNFVITYRTVISYKKCLS